MSLKSLIAQITLLCLLSSGAGAQSLIHDGFSGDTLPIHWTQTSGNASNYTVANGKLNILNANGGYFDGNWTYTQFKADFSATDSFFVYAGYTYQRTDYRLFDFYLYNNHNLPVVWFRIWDSPSKWILIGQRPAEPKAPCYTEISTSYVPPDLEIWRSQGIVSLGWAGSANWQCAITDTIAYIVMSFGQYTTPVQMQIDSIYAYSCSPIRVTRLLVDNQSDSAHIVSHTPFLSWGVVDGIQSEYELQVGVDEDWSLAENWNSGPVVGTDSSVNYAGGPLVDGQTYYLRLHISDTISWSPWYYSSFRMNSVPTVPVMIGPIDMAIVGSYPNLWVSNSVDAENDPLTYDYAGFHDTDCVAGPAIELNNVPSGQDSTAGAITEVLAENCRYWWRVRAFDGYEYSTWTSYGQFLVNGANEPPAAFTLTSPPQPDGKPVFNLLPQFVWQAAVDLDPQDTVRYKLEVSDRANFAFAYVRDSLLGTSFTISDSLEFGTHYWWRVTAWDRQHASTPAATTEFWTWELGDVDHSHGTDIGDLTTLIDNLFISFEPIAPMLVADVTGDCQVDIGDLTALINHLFITFEPLKVGCE